MALIFLTGMSGVGKTTVGQLLAAKLGVLFVDLDQEIERAAGQPIESIFPESGESVFRDYETEALVVVSALPEAVIALGAGVLERDENFEIVKQQGALVYLKAEVEVLLSRPAEWRERPLLAGAETRSALRHRLQQMLERRRARFEMADATVEVTGRDSVGDVAQRVLVAVREKERDKANS